MTALQEPVALQHLLDETAKSPIDLVVYASLLYGG